MNRSRHESDTVCASEEQDEIPEAPPPVPWFVAKCRAGSGSNFDLPVLDLSAGGCLVKVGFRAFKLGERVLVRLPGLSAVPAEVVWVEETTAGIAFESVLHDAVLEHLVAARQI
ncbi:MAG: PilZ domain-containing protein [Novosphingobium sp.]